MILFVASYIESLPCLFFLFLTFSVSFARMLSGVAPLSVLPPPPQLRESRTKKYFEILWDVSEINSRINFKPPNPCYLISAATFLYSCVLGIVWSTWKPLCSKNYIGMSPLYELWVKALFFCHADPLFCRQKKHNENWFIEDCFCHFFFLSKLPIVQVSFSPFTLLYFGPVYIYIVRWWHSSSLLLT